MDDMVESGGRSGDAMETKRGLERHLINTAEYLTSQSFIKVVVA